MDADFNIKPLSIILAVVLVILVLLFFVIANNKTDRIKSHVGRYTSNVDIDSNSQNTLKEYGINVNGSYKYELILKNDDTFILYITALNKYAYTGNYDKGINKYTLKAFRLYELDNNCFKRDTKEFRLKTENKSLINSDITGKNILFIKYDDNITKYDDSIKEINIECGMINY